MNHHYEVIIGNIGTVFSGPEYHLACNTYSSYVLRSKDECGRAAGEDVTLMKDGEPMWEHAGHLACRE